MATKPLTTPQIWASNANYTTGPFIGSQSKVAPGAAVAAEGHRPGALFPTPAEYENEQQNQITTWIVNWLFLGSSAGAPDAHIVETDSTGRATLHGLDVNDTVDESAVRITSVSTTDPVVDIACTTGGIGVEVDIGNAASVCYVARIGAADAFGVGVFMTASTAASAGVTVIANGATTGNGIEVTHAGAGDCIDVVVAGTGRGIDVTGGTSVEAVRVIAGNNQVGISATGAGTGFAATFDAGATATAAAQATGSSATSYGMHARTAAAGNASSAGVFAEGRGTAAMGCYARSDAGIGMVAQGDLSSPGYPAVRIVPQDADPSAYTSDGAMLWHSVMKQLRHCVAGFDYKSFLSYGPGSACHAISTQAIGVEETDNTGVFAVLLTARCLDSEGNGFYGVADGAGVYIKFSCDVRTNGASDYLKVQINDVTGVSSTIEEWSGTGGTATDAFAALIATSAWQRSVCVVIPYPPSVEGDLIVEVQIARQTSFIAVRNARLEIIGTFA